MAEKLARATWMVLEELESATSRYGPFNSGHEGYAIIKEELEELWEEVKNHQVDGDKAAMTKEAVQVAAMALRFLVDICDLKDEEV